METQKILDAANTLIPTKFIAWAQTQNLNPEILNRDDVFNVNRDDVELKVGGIILKFSNGKVVE